MICVSFLWLVFFTGTIGTSWGYEDPFILPACEDKGPEDVYLDLSNGDYHWGLSASSMFESSIKCLNYANSRINKIDENAFDSVPHLYYLNLGGNPIEFDNLITTNVPNLKTLILDGPFRSHDYKRSYEYNRQIQHFHRNPYDKKTLPKLKKLSLNYYGPEYSHLSNSRLTALNVPMLTHLYLSGNYLNTIANLEKMPNLTHLNLDDNRIEYISGSLLTNLEYLSMKRNTIVKVCATYCTLHSIAPREMYNLKYLSLAENKIRVVDSDAFADLENLRILNLSGNKINEFQQHTFSNMTKLLNLTLDYNNLTRVPDVSALQELEVLSLNGNKIMVIDPMTFHDLPKLAVIYLRENSMTTIANMAFGNVPTLTMLDLSWNDINFLPEKWILPNESLKVLRLDGNEFTDIGNMTLEQLHNLNSLGLAYNPIKKISARALMKMAADVVIDVILDSSVPPEELYHQ